jgi:hypothetical protein
MTFICCLLSPTTGCFPDKERADRCRLQQRREILRSLYLVKIWFTYEQLSYHDPRQPLSAAKLELEQTTTLITSYRRSLRQDAQT